MPLSPEIWLELQLRDFSIFVFNTGPPIMGQALCQVDVPGGASVREPVCQCRRCKRDKFSPWVGKIPWRRKWQPSPVFLPGESHGQRSLLGFGPQGHKELDTTEVTEHTHSHCTRSQAPVINKIFTVSFTVDESSQGWEWKRKK